MRVLLKNLYKRNTFLQTRESVPSKTLKQYIQKKLEYKQKPLLPILSPQLHLLTAKSKKTGNRLKALQNIQTTIKKRLNSRFNLIRNSPTLSRGDPRILKLLTLNVIRPELKSTRLVNLHEKKNQLNSRGLCKQNNLSTNNMWMQFGLHAQNLLRLRSGLFQLKEKKTYNIFSPVLFSHYLRMWYDWRLLLRSRRSPRFLKKNPWQFLSTNFAAGVVVRKKKRLFKAFGVFKLFQYVSKRFGVKYNSYLRFSNINKRKITSRNLFINKERLLYQLLRENQVVKSVFFTDSEKVRAEKKKLLLVRSKKKKKAWLAWLKKTRAVLVNTKALRADFEKAWLAKQKKEKVLVEIINAMGEKKKMKF